MPSCAARVSAAPAIFLTTQLKMSLKPDMRGSSTKVAVHDTELSSRTLNRNCQHIQSIIHTEPVSAIACVRDELRPAAPPVTTRINLLNCAVQKLDS